MYLVAQNTKTLGLLWAMVDMLNAVHYFLLPGLSSLDWKLRGQAASARSTTNSKGGATHCDMNVHVPIGGLRTWCACRAVQATMRDGDAGSQRLTTLTSSAGP